MMVITFPPFLYSYTEKKKKIEEEQNLYAAITLPVKYKNIFP